jgi:predicted nucleic acid-binding protein
LQGKFQRRRVDGRQGRDADDEMVLEVAVNGRADRLLTFNERDFASAARFGIMVERPGPAWRSWRKE